MRNLSKELDDCLLSPLDMIVATGLVFIYGSWFIPSFEGN
jgi:hypothetical protein